jgi:hypothetical protein
MPLRLLALSGFIVRGAQGFPFSIIFHFSFLIFHFSFVVSKRKFNLEGANLSNALDTAKRFSLKAQGCALATLGTRWKSITEPCKGSVPRNRVAVDSSPLRFPGLPKRNPGL